MSVSYTFLPPEGAITSVDVTFTYEGKIHVRPVNAVFDSDGVYDATATEERVQQVALGVQNKMISGAIVEPTEDPAANTP